MLKPKAISLNYDDKNDRIRLIFRHPTEKQRTDGYLTRRFLMKSMPQLVDWLAEKAANSASNENATTSVLTGNQKQTLAQFEHQGAQRRIPTTREPMKTDEENISQFLISAISLRSNKEEKVELTLMEQEKQPKVCLQLTRAELHKLISELLSLAEKADWSLPDYWGPSVNVVTVNTGMH